MLISYHKRNKKLNTHEYTKRYRTKIKTTTNTYTEVANETL